MRTRVFCLKKLFIDETQPVALDSACSFEIGCRALDLDLPSTSSLYPDFIFNGGRTDDTGSIDFLSTKVQYAFAICIMAKYEAAFISATGKYLIKKNNTICIPKWMLKL